MGRKITKISLTDEGIVVYEKRIIPLSWIADEKEVEKRGNTEQLAFMHFKGFSHLLYGFSGYGYGRKDFDGKWYPVDIRESKMQRPNARPLNREQLKHMVRSLAISEYEWNPKCNEIPVTISHSLLRNVR